MLQDPNHIQVVYDMDNQEWTAHVTHTKKCTPPIKRTLVQPSTPPASVGIGKNTPHKFLEVPLVELGAPPPDL